MEDIQTIAWYQQPLIRHLALVIVAKVMLLTAIWFAFFSLPEPKANTLATSRAIVGEPNQGANKP
jgi:hypothetical protein